MPFARGQALTLALKCEETSLSITVIKTQEHVFGYCVLHLTRSTSWRSGATSICVCISLEAQLSKHNTEGKNQTRGG